MGLFDFFKPRTVPVTQEAILDQAEKIVERAMRTGRPQMVFEAFVGILADYSSWQKHNPKWVSSEIESFVADSESHPAHMSFGFGGWKFECIHERKPAPDYDGDAAGQDSVSVSCGGELIFQAQATRYSGEWSDDWGHLWLTAYKEGDPLQALVAAAQAIERHYKRMAAGRDEESIRQRVAEAKKNFGI
jgi:hypothetical protein